MGRRLAGWRSLDWRERCRLLTCMAGLGLVHGALALLGYARTRRVIEALTRRSVSRTAGPADIEDARALARLAAIAGNNGAIEATCLRQSLLLVGWLRIRGLCPILHLGVKGHPGKVLAHAWVELEGKRLRGVDAEYKSFLMPRQQG